ncbi:hypothetical protein SAMN05661012_04624 [Chitinophaga sancti]|uniref:Uncharacterized protein n=1 Tax=Chitinophaga sancti TaxID=1004 RepID=A0A1K1S2J1_9BACT|nr:hypothetical protein SAMN05661012_04624 [Chitinophaga sancti]
MNVNLQEEKQTILAAMDRTKRGCWATPLELSRISGIDLERVLRVVYNSYEFLQCSYLSDDGLPMFTSRKIYKERAPLWNKFLSFIKSEYV